MASKNSLSLLIECALEINEGFTYRDSLIGRTVASEFLDNKTRMTTYLENSNSTEKKKRVRSAPETAW